MAQTTVGSQTLALLDRLMAGLDGPELKIERRDSSIVLTPQLPKTYSITVYDQGEDAMVAADRWHAHYDDPLQAAYCARWLLTPFYRIVRELKGGVLVATWLERYEATGWEAFEPAYFLNPEDAPSWSKAPNETILHRIIQQNVLPAPVPYAQVSPGVVLDERGLPLEFESGEWSREVGAAVGPTLF